MRNREESMSALLHYHWPGNIRELRNVIERAMILSQGPKLYVQAQQRGAETGLP